LKTYIVAAAEGISPAAALLSVGDIVALPTETVYGLGADALNPTACAKIFEAKDRPLYDPLIVHIPDRKWLVRLAVASDCAHILAENFWPGPLTLVLPRTGIVPDIVTSGQETIAIRMSAHPDFQAVARIFGNPIAAPSANRFGRISPTSADHVVEELDGRIPLVVDGGDCAHGVESTIVLVRGSEIHILRNGPITAEELARFGTVRGLMADISAPGGLASHYAPSTPLVIEDLVADGAELPFMERASRLLSVQQNGGADGHPSSIGLLAWSHSGEGFAHVEHLSKTQNLREAATNLYGAMRRLDAAGHALIIAESVPEHGLGAAIMERLRKASAR